MSDGLIVDKNKYNCYYNDMVVYAKAAQLTSMCAEICFYNKGTSTMVVNGIPFAPGTGISLDGKLGELDVTKYTLSFTGAGVNAAFVIRKCYTQ